MVHALVTLMDETLLLTEGSDNRRAQQGFIEVGVNWGTTDRLQTLQLAR